jgi:hypothetical protein
MCSGVVSASMQMKRQWPINTHFDMITYKIANTLYSHVSREIE